MAIQIARVQSYRRLTLIVATINLFSNALSAYYFYNFGDDPLELSLHLSAYGVFASILAVLGFFGAKRNNATMVTVFSNFLVLDVLFSMIPRVLAITLFPSLEGLVCSPDSVNAWLQAQPALHGADKERVLGELIGQCHNVMGVGRMLFVLASLAITFVQCWLALQVSQYASHLRHSDIEGALCLPEEAAPSAKWLEDAKGDRY